MIKPSDMHDRTDLYGFPSPRIQVALELRMERFARREEIDRETERCRREIWHHIYGDIIREVQATERAIYPSLAIGGGYEQASSAFNRLKEMLEFKAAEAVA